MEKSFHNWVVLITGLFYPLTGAIGTAHADNLTDILNSPRMAQFSLESRQIMNRNARRGRVWIKKGSSLYKIFNPSVGGPSLLINWIGGNISGYRKINEHAQIKYEYAYASAKYQNSNEKQFKVEVLLPHPKYRSSVEFGLIQAFNKYKPPVLKVKKQEVMSIKGHKARLYISTANNCSIVLNTLKSGLINIAQSDCRDFKGIIKFARSLDLIRLKRKLSL
ncbi:MAG: hypothetical protein D6719_05525 [Candidatus Dadabacteria bacterium]|nr:MAG: hypothetical protein D6719_05525 [Candidatus Dadabacteria bacterium]